MRVYQRDRDKHSEWYGMAGLSQKYIVAGRGIEKIVLGPMLRQNARIPCLKSKF